MIIYIYIDKDKIFFFKQKTAYEMRISDWSSDVCSSDLKDRLAIALKGASETLRTLIFTNMAERAAKILKEDMEALGPVRLRDVDEAQVYVVNLAKEMAARGELVIADSKGDDELVY